MRTIEIIHDELYVGVAVEADPDVMEELLGKEVAVVWGVGAVAVPGALALQASDQMPPGVQEILNRTYAEVPRSGRLFESRIRPARLGMSIPGTLYGSLTTEDLDLIRFWNLIDPELDGGPWKEEEVVQVWNREHSAIRVDSRVHSIAPGQNVIAATARGTSIMSKKSENIQAHRFDKEYSMEAAKGVRIAFNGLRGLDR